MASYFEQRMAEINAEREAWQEANRDAIRAEIKKAEKAAKARMVLMGHVYFMKAGNAVKIGFSTNLRERMKSIQTGCAEPARIVKIVPGDIKTERRFHERFAEYRMKGEWFDLRGRLAKYLERCIHQIELPAPIPPPDIRL